MKKYLMLLMLLPVTLYSTEKADSLKSWNFGGLASFNMSQVSLTNWSAGGRSSSSGVAFINVFENYKKDNISWENSLNMGYGLLKEQDNAVVKSNDKFELNSKFGLKKTEKLYLSSLFNFKTQFAPGYFYPNTIDPISRFMAPGYLTLALGIDYKPNKMISIFISPLTDKTTFVCDTTLSNAGAFGVTPGEKVRCEIGSYVKMEIKAEIMKNVNLSTQVNFFSNYIDHPENIDINWDFLLNMKINNFLSANLITNMIYDDNIKTVKDNNGVNEMRGARIQFKEMFGLGLNFKF